MTGIFQFTATFGAFETNETTLLSAGFFNIFVAKYAGGGVPDTDGDGVPDSVDACPSTPTGEAVDASGCTPVQTTQNLIDDVQALVDSGVLNQGQGNSLTAELEGAVAKLDQGNITAAINKLQAFINQVNAFLNAGILTPAQAESLTDAANSAIDQLSS